MKIRIKLSHGSWETSQTGKGKFILRLVPELEKLGCKITDSLDEEVDLDFQISRRHYQPVKCKKTALRIGPAYLTKEKRGKWLNHRKKEGVKHSDAVIYQSELGKKMCDKFIYKRNGLSRIIFNGSDRTEITPFSSPFEHNFLASTRVWKKQKRLSDIKKAFLKANIKDSCLWVLGDTGKEPRDKNYHTNNGLNSIREIGGMSDHQIKMFYKLCDAVIHITFMDCMPNAVCEALSEGCRVLCNNNAGTKEIVGPAGGLVLNLEPEWDGKAINVNKPPKINLDLLANGFREILGYPAPKNDHVLIENIAKEYYDFFQEVLK